MCACMCVYACSVLQPVPGQRTCLRPVPGQRTSNGRRYRGHRSCSRFVPCRASRMAPGGVLLVVLVKLPYLVCQSVLECVPVAGNAEADAVWHRGCRCDGGAPACGSVFLLRWQAVMCVCVSVCMSAQMSVFEYCVSQLYA